MKKGTSKEGSSSRLVRRQLDQTDVDQPTGPGNVVSTTCAGAVEKWATGPRTASPPHQNTTGPHSRETNAGVLPETGWTPTDCKIRTVTGELAGMLGKIPLPVKGGCVEEHHSLRHGDADPPAPSRGEDRVYTSPDVFTRRRTIAASTATAAIP
ncbi:unnamed protein product [Arctogadus glacialis]